MGFKFRQREKIVEDIVSKLPKQNHIPKHALVIFDSKGNPIRVQLNTGMSLRRTKIYCEKRDYTYKKVMLRALEDEDL